MIEKRDMTKSLKVADRCQHLRYSEIIGNEKGSENNEDITVAWYTRKTDMGMAKNGEVVFCDSLSCY